MVTVQRSAAGHGMTAQQMLWRFQQTRRARPCASGYRYFPFEQSSGYRYFRHTTRGYGSENAQVSGKRPPDAAASKLSCRSRKPLTCG